MKLYSCSIKSQTFVELKWALARFLVGGILLGAAIVFGLIKLNQHDDDPLRRPANTLEIENKFLREQLDLFSSRVGRMEIQAAQLNELAGKLELEFHRQQIAVDTLSNTRTAVKKTNLRSMIFAAKDIHP